MTAPRSLKTFTRSDFHLSFSGKGGILAITNQGCAGAHAEGPLGSAAKHFLKARTLSQVKIWAEGDSAHD
jgi:hypothetical protein